MSSDEKTTVLERLARFVSPGLLFLGIAIGFGAAVVCGHQAGTVNLYGDRERFFHRLTPEANVYPTLDHLCQYVRHRADPQKILVIVGGDSVMLGVGQHERALWTKELQKQLGDEFCVVNLAFRGAMATEMAAVVAETLAAEYPKLYLVVRQIPLDATEKWLRNGTYDYLFWQAVCAGRMPPNDNRKRQAIEAITARDEEKRSAAIELAIRGVFENVTGASNLWNLVAHQKFTTVFNRLIVPPWEFWKPTCGIWDDEIENLGDMNTAAADIPANEKENLTRLIRGVVEEPQEGVWRMVDSKLKFREGARAFEQDTRAGVLFVSFPIPEAYLKLIDENLQRKYEFMTEQNWIVLRQAGLDAVFLKDLRNSDFRDRVHLSDAATPQVAKAVAAALGEMARKDDYFDEGK